MSIPIVNINIEIISPAELRESSRGTYASLIVNTGTTKRSDWYANVYPIDKNGNFGDLAELVNAPRGTRAIINGAVRNWTRQSGFDKGRSQGTTIDIQGAVILSDSQTEEVESDSAPSS